MRWDDRAAPAEALVEGSEEDAAEAEEAEGCSAHDAGLDGHVEVDGAPVNLPALLVYPVNGYNLCVPRSL